MARFNARYPGIAITIENGTYSPIEDMPSSSLLDCAFVALPSRAEFETVPLARDRLLAVVHPDSPLAAKRSLSAGQDVANETFIVPAEGTNHDVGRFFSRAGIRPKAVLNMGDDYAAAAMVERALGFHNTTGAYAKRNAFGQRARPCRLSTAKGRLALP